MSRPDHFHIRHKALAEYVNRQTMQEESEDDCQKCLEEYDF